MHARTLPERAAEYANWPAWLPEKLVEIYRRLGVSHPWRHQVEAMEAARVGHTIISTGTASGKTLGYQVPIAAALHEDPRATALYLSPTKALGADQLASWKNLVSNGAGWLEPTSYDGDTPVEQRRWARENANVVVTNPDMLHVGILPYHAGWTKFFRNLRYVVIDEAHTYRGVFGSHVAVVLRRLRRILHHYGNRDAIVIGASATSAAPQTSFGRLIDAEVTAVTEDTSGHGAVTVGFWQPEFSSHTGENGAPLRRSLMATGSDMLTDLALADIRSVAFIRSRPAAEAMAQSVKRQVSEIDDALIGRVAVYRAGLLPAERHQVEQDLDSGKLLAVATTPALELGIDIAGLDAVIIVGWPGTRASFFQQLGRAGRAQQPALAIYVAGDDPMDTYLVNHPDTIFDLAVEDSIIDASNPHILGPHLLAAAAELPMTPDDCAYFGPRQQVEGMLEEMTRAGYLRRRPAGWFWVRPESAAQHISLRDSGGGPLDIVDIESGAVLGNISTEQAHKQAHPGAIYVHQGRTWLVEDLDEDQRIVSVVREEPSYFTQARELTEVEVLSTDEHYDNEDFSWCFGSVVVNSQVISFQRKEVGTSRSLGEDPLDMPARELFTSAVWFQCPSSLLNEVGITNDRMPGSLHAAEHAMIGMMPLVASNDRWDIGGVSMVMHPDTGVPTVFIYDGHPGGAGFAHRGFEAGLHWVQATSQAIASCGCAEGCPSCVQSPKCGNRNSPLDKQGAITVLNFVAEHLSAINDTSTTA